MSRIQRVRFGWVSSLLLVAIAPACASTSLQFPSAAEVGELAARPPSEKIAPDDLSDVERWQLTGPFPDAVASVPHAPSSAWDTLLAEAVSGRAGLALASESAHCVAREVGLFYLATHGLPAEPLRRFIEGRCGVAAYGVNTGYRWVDVGDDVPEDRLVREWNGDVRSDVDKGLANVAGPELAGIWFGRKNGRAAVIWAVARRQVQVDRIPLVPTGGRLVVSGEMLIQAEHVQGLATAGPFGVRRCVADPQVALPRFSLTCDVERTDASATVEIAAFPPGRILGPIVLSLLVWPAGVPGDTFVRPSIAPASPSPSPSPCQSAPGAELGSALAGCVNYARARAQLPPLQLAPGQSEIAGRLAPHFFAALLGAEPELVADKVVLGVRAGWNVGAPLRYGQFASGLVQGGAEVERLVASVLDRPGGREALLDPGAHRLAVGTIAGGAGQHVLGAVFGTYALFDGRDDPRDADRVFQRLGDRRARQGRSAPRRLPSIEGDVAVAARRIAAEGRAPTAALNDALESTAARIHGAVRGWWIDAAKLDELELPADIVQAPALNVAVAVSHYRPEGDPWTRYVVVLVIASPQQTLALAGGGGDVAMSRCRSGTGVASRAESRATRLVVAARQDRGNGTGTRAARVLLKSAACNP